MRVFILGLDGLEWTIAKDYANLRQVEWGRVDTWGTKTWTPLCWACIITGLPPEQATKQLVKKGRYWLLKEGTKTIFDLTRKHVKLFIPCINPHPRYWSKEDIDLLQKALFQRGIWRAKYELACRNLLYEQFNEVMKHIDSDWELFMVHFNNPDMYQHVFICNERKVRDFYKLLNDLVGKIWAKLGHDVARLIISDHGFRCEQGKIPSHANDAFYSCNIRLGLNYPKLWDFYNIIAELLRR